MKQQAKRKAIVMCFDEEHLDDHHECRREINEFAAELRALHKIVDKLPEWAVEVQDIATSIDPLGHSAIIRQLQRLGREITEAAAKAAGGE